jgi:hypothetical protein
MATGVAFYHPLAKPVSSLTKAMPLSSFLFTVSGSPTVQALVYQDPFLKFPYNGNPVADEAGNFKPIFLDPRIQYRLQLVDLNGNVQYTLDPYLPPCPTLGSGPIQVNPNTGEVLINPPTTGISASLSIRKNSGSFSIACPGNATAGTVQPALLQFVNCLITGTQTANTAGVTNKPGGAFPNVAFWLPILGDGGITYYIPLWG